jgi:hypothetical protein
MSHENLKTIHEVFLMHHNYRSGKPTIGVLAGWQFYRTATNLSYLKPIFNGINHAAQDLSCNVFFACGMGASARPEDPIRPAWPIPAPDVDNIPISPLNTDGLIVFNPLHSAARSQYIQDLIRAGHPVLFIGSGEPGPTLVTDNSSGIFEAIQHLVDHGHRQIAFLAGSPDDMSGDTGERLSAYQSALEAMGWIMIPAESFLAGMFTMVVMQPCARSWTPTSPLLPSYPAMMKWLWGR